MKGRATDETSRGPLPLSSLICSIACLNLVGIPEGTSHLLSGSLAHGRFTQAISLRCGTQLVELLAPPNFSPRSGCIQYGWAQRSCHKVRSRMRELLVDRFLHFPFMRCLHGKGSS